MSIIGRPAACLELASEVLEQPYDSRKLYMLSGGSTSLAKHKQSVRSIRSILNIHNAGSNNTITTSALCIKFGCPGLKDFAAVVHDDYKVIIIIIIRTHAVIVHSCPSHA